MFSGPTLDWVNPLYTQKPNLVLTETIKCTSGDFLISNELVTFVISDNSGQVVFDATQSQTCILPTGVLGTASVNIVSLDKSEHKFTLNAGIGINGNISAKPLELTFSKA